MMCSAYFGALFTEGDVELGGREHQRGQIGYRSRVRFAHLRGVRALSRRVWSTA